jgi:hypothetical protein
VLPFVASRGSRAPANIYVHRHALILFCFQHGHIVSCTCRRDRICVMEKKNKIERITLQLLSRFDFLILFCCWRGAIVRERHSIRDISGSPDYVCIRADLLISWQTPRASIFLFDEFLFLILFFSRKQRNRIESKKKGRGVSNNVDRVMCVRAIKRGSSGATKNSPCDPV